MGNFTISTSLTADGATTVHVRGDIDAAASEDLKAALLNEVTRRRPPSLVVDMLHVTFIDSTGLGALLTAQRAARGLGTSLVVREVSTFLERQLRIAGIYEVLTGHR